MPRLVKDFPALWLSADAVLAAVRQFERVGGIAVLNGPSEVRRDHETWELDDLAGFISAYERGPCSARMALGDAEHSLQLTCTPSSTTIAIRHPTGAAIDEIEAALSTERAPSRPAHRLSVFIGHGRRAEWRLLSAHLAAQHGVEVATYENGSQVGQPAMTVLAQISDRVDFAVLIHTAEIMGADGSMHAVPNVVHETGYFQARLGHHRALIVREETCQPFTNIGGLTEVRFSRGEIHEAFGHIVARLPWDAVAD